jgi:hypothetical protein
MRKPTLLPSFSPLRLTLLGLTVVMTVLALLSVPAPVEAGCNGYIYCTEWGWAEGCCIVFGSYRARQSRECTDGAGNFCTEFRCTSNICAV